MKTKVISPALIAALSAVLAGLVGIAMVLTFWWLPQGGDPTGWYRDEGGQYYLDADGNRLCSWQEIQGETYYFDHSTGYLYTDRWLALEEGKYYLDGQGRPVVGLLNTSQGTYYFDIQGIMVTGWTNTEDGRRYFAQDGKMTVGFLDMEDNRYFFNQNGVLCTGWQTIENSWYYFDKDGVMNTATGWLNTEDGTWYVQENGQPYIGWMFTEKARYYFLSDGKMATGMVNVDGLDCYFSSDGNYVPLVNPWNKVPEIYTAQLVKIEGHLMDSTCVEALRELITAARAAGLTCELNSSYRDMDTQIYLWNRRYDDYISQGYSEEEAYRLTARRVAYPGTSEHHTGLAIDIVELVKDGTLYAWFNEHAWEYGFTVRYKGEKETLTGIKDEPWHLRYVGKEMAQILQERDLCVEEYWNELLAKQAE